MAFVTAEEVLTITGRSVSAGQIDRSARIIELYTGNLVHETLSVSDQYWLKLANAYQVVYDEDFPVSSRPRADIKSISQGDLSTSFSDDVLDAQLAPLAKKAIRRLSSYNKRIRVRTLWNRGADFDDTGWGI